jgi:hypothetical protein
MSSHIRADLPALEKELTFVDHLFTAEDSCAGYGKLSLLHLIFNFIRRYQCPAVLELSGRVFLELVKECQRNTDLWKMIGLS